MTQIRKLYVLSKAMEGGPRLIGILSEHQGEYEFEYKLGGKEREWYLHIWEFPDITKVYRGKDVEKFVKRLVPRKESPYIAGFLKDAGLAEYDEWELLKIHGLRNMNEDAFLYENLPNGVITYEEMGAKI